MINPDTANIRVIFKQAKVQLEYVFKRSFMKYGFKSVVLLAGFWLLSTGICSANENKTEALQPAVKANVSSQNAGNAAGAKQKHKAKTKLVDINSATKDQLMTLPGISATEADKIVAGRPYGSKAWLVSNKIISAEAFQAVNRLIVCRLTKDIVAKITAPVKQKNKPSIK
jgi:hypothetical protein